LAMDFVLGLRRSRGFAAALARGMGLDHVHGIGFRDEIRNSRGTTGFFS
jgi:hypothetical protein